MTFKDKLNTIAKKNNSLVCVGLDSDLAKIPPHLKTSENPQFEFNKTIINATYDLVCAYKPNTAFYEAEGSEGIRQLKLTFVYLKDKYPDIPVILDAKRADIGNTNLGYIKYAFEYLEADAITLHWYVGKEGLKPFLDLADKGLFIYCRSSNAGAGEFQDLFVMDVPPGRSPSGHLPGVVKDRPKTTSGVGPMDIGHSPDGEGNSKPLYQVIAEHITKEWNYNNNCGLIFGATYPAELEIVRHIVSDMPLLVPGIGAQGGDVEKTVNAGVDKHGLNAIINSSRGIIFASSDTDFAQKAREETIKLKEEINKYR